MPVPAQTRDVAVPVDLKPALQVHVAALSGLVLLAGHGRHSLAASSLYEPG